MHTWYVTFENKRILRRGRHPRLTKTFATEAKAKAFARQMLDQGVIVFAGTINPHLPKQLISSTAAPVWIESVQQQVDGS
jgi:hypothetical protein